MSTIQPFDFSVDLLSALLWQYNDALRLQALLEQKQGWYNTNQTDYWTDWTTDVFDLRTANDFGCSVWAVILDMPLSVTSGGDPEGKPIWGFGQYRKNYNNGNFASAAGSGLTTAQKRIVLQLRYFQLVTRGAIPEVNAFLAYVFAGSGAAYVVDSLAMELLYVFEFPLTSSLEVVLTEFDLLPRPGGVGVRYVTVVPGRSWGFGRFHKNYNNGNFYHA